MGNPERMQPVMVSATDERMSELVMYIRQNSAETKYIYRYQCQEPLILDHIIQR